MHAMTYKIERGVPVPRSGSGRPSGLRDAMRTMKKGESMWVPAQAIRAARLCDT